MSIRPILFNSDMVREILCGRKTVARRLLSKRVEDKWRNYEAWATSAAPPGGTLLTEKEFYGQYPPCQPGDILYVRETWQEWTGGYLYKAWPEGIHQPGYFIGMPWCPSIHMPKEAARIFLKVKSVRSDRLRDMEPVDVIKEGGYSDCCDCLDTYGESGSQCCYKTEDECSQCDSVMVEWEKLWNSTIKKSDLDRYGWDANPWVWVIEFERCEKPEGWCRE